MSWIGIPIAFGDEVLGAIDVSSHKREYSLKEVYALQRVAKLIGIAIKIMK